ncbi:MAG: hypothetical protein KGL56_11270 [Alphaproteobacteria bacterium]|nr:hypothetical protein [Alphaproteobacteria bacterium]MDE2500759.1 hypothetical protein [Alphaproteobacteria bacterium]
MKMRAVLIPVCMLGCIGYAAGADFHFEGFADLRLIVPSTQGSYYYGDLGKTRYGYDDGKVAAELSDIVGEESVQIRPALTAVATGRVSTHYGPAVDLIEAYARYQPSSTTAWLWSVKAGAFFPPISLENDQIGWTSAWTITPSAINSWVGYELRTIGAEGTLEWRHAGGVLTMNGAVFGWNDPAGVLMADRGWSFDDRVSGLLEHERIPDAMAASLRRTPPIQTRLFSEIDNSPGWYAKLSWMQAGLGHVEVMHYDNNADPSAKTDGQFAWHTRFWDIGYRKQIGNLALLAQAMTGSTEIRPAPLRRNTTNFAAAYILAGLDIDPWRLAARFDAFRTHTLAATPSLQNEDGTAGTVSATWFATTWLQLTGEILVVDSMRPQRTLAGDPARATETQSQLLARVYF